MESYQQNIFTKSLIKFIIVGTLLSLLLLPMETHIRTSDFNIFKHEVKNQLFEDATSLKLQFEYRIEKMINDVSHLPTPFGDVNRFHIIIDDFLKRNISTFAIQFFTSDGSIVYSSVDNKVGWQSNLLNRYWYRQLIKSWQPVISEVYQSPISPFPKIIAIAVPVTVAEKIKGFWLVSLDVNKLDSFFPENIVGNIQKSTIWYDRTGNIIKIDSQEQNRISTKIVNENHWWHTINEVDNDSSISIEYLNNQSEKSDEYFFAMAKSEYGQIQCLIIQPKSKSLELYDNFGSTIFNLLVIIHIILLITLWIIIYQLEKRKIERTLYNNQTDKLYSTNDLLKVRTNDLLVTNEKLNKLTTLLTEQKRDLLNLNNNLKRLQKYLNFLTVPVITIDEHFKINYVNKATESELGQPIDKILGKKLSTILKVNGLSIDNFLRKVKSSFKRSELNISLTVNKKIKNYLLICDYLKLPDWKGYILTLTDLTELLNLQHDISTQNNFLNYSSRLISNFLNFENEDQILKNALKIIKEYTNAKCILLYQMENDDLVLKEHININRKEISKKINPQESITFSTLNTGQSILIKHKSDLPQNTTIVESKWKFYSAIFKPVIINKNSVAALVILDPENEIFNDYSTKFIKFLNQFELGYNTYLSHIELKEKNKDLDENARFRSQLLRSITHGINTPLSTIHGYTKLLEMKFSAFINKNIVLKDYLNKLHDATENIVQKSELYLDLARFNRNGLQLNEQDINITDFIRSIEEFINEEAKSRSLKLTILKDINDDLSLKVDFKRVKKSINTILLNALKYAPHNDNVSLKFEKTNNQMNIEFEDHGPIIKSENIALIGSEFLPDSLSQERIHFEDNLSISFAVKLIRYIEGELTIMSNRNKTVHTITIPLNEKKIYEKTA